MGLDVSRESVSLDVSGELCDKEIKRTLYTSVLCKNTGAGDGHCCAVEK